MATPSTTSALLTEPEAILIASTRRIISAAESRIALLGYNDDATPERIRGAARSAEALSHAADALSSALIALEVFGKCPIAKQAREGL